MAVPIPTPIPDDVKARFWAKVQVCGPEDCWDWTAGSYSTGYGCFMYAGEARKAHRVSAAIHGIDLSDIIRHKCDNRACVNPAHLEPGSIRDNNADMWSRGRAGGLPARNARQTICKRGHPLSGDNVRVTNKGYRSCRACHRARLAAIRSRMEPDNGR